jgi:hypothetical protein
MKPADHARQIAETARALNHSTAGANGYERPLDVDAVLAELRLTAIRMEQALDQARSWLVCAHQRGQVAHDHGNDIGAAIASADYRISEAAARSEWLAMDLSEVRAITAHLIETDLNDGVIPTLENLR